jgi:hypothetical protein
VAVERLEALIIGPKSDPSFGFGQLALPEFAGAAGDIGRPSLCCIERLARFRAFLLRTKKGIVYS